MIDSFTTHYDDMLTGSYDCVDRIVLNAYFPLGHNPAGFRYWWRKLNGNDDNLDDTHLIRMAGRFSRKLIAFAKSRDIPIIHCGADTRKHLLAEEYLAKNPGTKGLFIIIVAKAPVSLWEVKRFARGGMDIRKKRSKSFVNHYHFHIIDPEWGHITFKLSGHPPFPVQVMLNGHEYAECLLKKNELAFTKEGNCFTQIEQSSGLALVADALRLENAIGRLSQVCDRWLYSVCLCCALTLEEQERSGFRYQYSVYQIEYSRNLLFRRGLQMDQVFEGMLDRTRSRIDIARIKTILGLKHRPYSRRSSRRKPPQFEVLLEKPVYGLTVFKVHFGRMTLKGYTKGERVLRFEVIVHNVRELKRGCVLERFTDIIAYLQAALETFLNSLDKIDRAFISDEEWENLPSPSQVGKSHVGGVDVNKSRMRAVMRSVLTLSLAPRGFSSSSIAAEVRRLTGLEPEVYRASHAAYDLRKLRGKNLVHREGSSRRYNASPQGLQNMAATLALREDVMKPVLAGISRMEQASQVASTIPLDVCYANVRNGMKNLLAELGFAA